MDLQFIDRVVKATLIITALFFPFLALYVDFSFALAVALGAGWGSLNLLLLKIIFVSLLVPGKKKIAMGLIILLVKLPILYAAGYLLLSWDFLPTGGLVWGFSGILIVMFLKVLGRQLSGMGNEIEAGAPRT